MKAMNQKHVRVYIISKHNYKKTTSNFQIILILAKSFPLSQSGFKTSTCTTLCYGSQLILHWMDFIMATRHSLPGVMLAPSQINQ